MRPISVGITLPIGQGIALSEVVALARHAEAAGLDAVNVGEYASSDALALAAALAAVTERIRIETGVVTLAGRSVAALAMQAATVAGVSEGRFVLGLGAGSPVVAGFHRTSFERPVSRLEIDLEDLRCLLAGQRTSDGAFGLRMPLPWRVPIVLSAVGSRMLRLAGTRADGVLLSLLCSPGMVERQATEAGRHLVDERPFDVIAIQHAAAAGFAETARVRVRKELAGYFVVPTYRPAALDLVGEDGLAAAEAAYRDGGTSALAKWIPDRAVDELFSAGEDITARVKAVEAAGATAVRFNAVTPVKGDIQAAMALVDELGVVTR